MTSKSDSDKRRRYLASPPEAYPRFTTHFSKSSSVLILNHVQSKYCPETSTTYTTAILSCYAVLYTRFALASEWYQYPIGFTVLSILPTMKRVRREHRQHLRQESIAPRCTATSISSAWSATPGNFSLIWSISHCAQSWTVGRLVVCRYVVTLFLQNFIRIAGWRYQSRETISNR